MNIYEDLLTLVNNAGIIEIFGEKSTGKTLFALLSAKDALTANKKVYYINTEKNSLPVNLNGIQYTFIKGYELKTVILRNQLELLKQQVQEPSFIVLDSLGWAALSDYVKMKNQNDKGIILQNCIAITGTLQDIAVNTDSLVIIINQPESEFDKINKSNNELEPFGDKHIYPITEIIRSVRLQGSPTLTVLSYISFKSSKFGLNKELYRITINTANKENPLTIEKKY